MTALVRAAAPADLPEIGRIHVEAWRWGYESFLAPEVLDGMDAARSVERTRLVWNDLAVKLIAEIDGIAVGYAFGTLSPGLAGVESEISSLYVAKHAARKGVGRALFAECCSQLRAAGARTLAVQAFEANHIGGAFYRKLGGVLEPERKGLWGDLPTVWYVWDDISTVVQGASKS